MVVLGVVGAMVAGAATIEVTQANFESCRTLQNGNTYRFAEDIDYTAASCQSAMTVAEGANVIIEIAKDVVVSLTGGAASGQTGAGAGIEVPSNAKLTITGSGALYVNGGNAADGVTGGQGDGAVITDESYWYTTSGSGGKGGAGGGGAGAGIGGKGGNGGAGGEGAAGVTDNWSGSYMQSGKAGNPGGNGNQGQTCGAVEICGAVTVIAKGGSSASRGGYGGSYSGREVAEGRTWYGAGYGGGGGGGGGGGVAASDIGGGGGGGGAGGGGGSGGICYFQYIDTVLMCKLNGDGGNGGKGVVGDVGIVNDYSGGFWTLFKDNLIWPGEETSAKINTVPYSSYTPGAGGAGGEAGATGGNGSLTVELTAICCCGTRSAYSVGKISDTEYIRWENEKLWRVKDGVYTEIAYETVQGWMGNFDGGKWYVVKGIVSRTDSITVDEGGVVNLVLLDRAALTVDCRSKDNMVGIAVLNGRALNIFGVASGALTALGGDGAAGIGGSYDHSGGTVTINGGTVMVTGGSSGAGIGGGSLGAGGTVTINGGTVTATGGHAGAGIGGGFRGNGGIITINGGTVTATGGGDGAGIGGGSHGAGGTVTINGGTVTATGGGDGAGVGAGFKGSSQGSLHLGPRVFEIGNNHYREGVSVSFHLPPTLRLASAVVDNGALVNTATQDGITSVCFLPAPRVTLNFALVDADSHFVGDSAITLGPVREDVTLETSALPQVVENVIGSVAYVLPDGGEMSASEVRPVHQTEAFGTKLSDGWYVVAGTVKRTMLEVNGVVNLILSDGAELTVTTGIRVSPGNALNIFCQRGATGKLIAAGSNHCAGIGGDEGAGGTVTINGGTVTAMGGYNAAGIGGGWAGAGGTVTINGGTVMVTGGSSGAGIGGGYKGAGGTVTINGGRVTATGSTSGAGIGGGDDGAAGIVTINGGTVMATGGNYGAGIGGGYEGAGGTVTINGGVVTAMGGLDGAGIGGGWAGAGGTVTINGGNVKASSVQSQPKNGDGENVYRVTMDGCGASCEITGLQGYGLKDVVPIDGMLYFYLPNDEYLFMVNGLTVKAIVNNAPVTAQVTYNGSVTIFNDGLHYLESSNGAFIHTGYKPTTSTRIVADMNPLAKTGNWLVFFGVTSGDNSKDGILLRHSDSDDINGWFCNEDHAQAKIGGLQNTRITAELKSGGMTLNGETSEITTTGAPYDGPIYLFCGNNGGGAWRHQQMRLYSFKIYDTVDGVANQLVRDFVPAQATEHPAIVGLYDRVTKQLYVNCGSGSFALGCDAPVGPTCEGGEIADSEDGVWVITPNEGVEAVTIGNLPEEAKVVVKLNGYSIPSEAFMGFGEGGVFSLALNSEVVQPKVGELDEGEPFVVGEGEVALTIKTIAGLKYLLIRGAEIGAITDTVVEPTIATEAEMTLKDENPPPGNAFYKVGVGK